MTEVFVVGDQTAAVVVSVSAKRAMLKHCQSAGDLETGGILIGYYSPLCDQAIITEVAGAPSDSVSGRWTFTRGIAGLQPLIDRAWRRGKYYLGEWHFHPFVSPLPSPRDRAQLASFSRDRAYRCPEPVLMVVGGDQPIGGELWVGAVLNGALRQFEPCRPLSTPVLGGPVPVLG